ncbi:MAG: hypothetical protein D8H97_02940 [Neisseria sp.]|jgi:hypothetical protein|nr:MAG: hypothetical protein D8H97_02940 [Neisseria sp.]
MAVLKLHTNPYAMTEDDKRVLAAYIHETMERFEQFCWDCHLNGTATQDQLERILCFAYLYETDYAAEADIADVDV